MNYFPVIKHAMRRLLRRPTLSFAAVATLGLAIGAGTAVFSVVNGVLLKPLPYPQADRLVHVFRQQPPVTASPISRPGFLELSGRNDLGVDIAGYSTSTVTLTGENKADRLAAASVSPGFFQVVGMRPGAGRWLGASDDAPDAELHVVISEGLAKRHFGAVRSALGRALHVDGDVYTVVGVAPVGFDTPTDADIWVPSRFWKSESGWGSNYIQLIGRLQPGVTKASVKERFDAVARDWIRERPQNHKGLNFRVIGFLDWSVGGVRDTLWVLLGAVLLVLLVACANVANLIVARVLSRSREFATHAAMGANARSLATLAAAEAVVLAVGGALLGIAVAAFSTKLMLSLAPSSLPRTTGVNMDGTVLGFAVAITMIAMLAAALMPAWAASRVSPATSLNASGRQPGSGRHRWRAALVCGEIAMSLVLLVGAVLLIGSLSRLSGVNPGFDTHNLLTAKLVLPTPAPQGGDDPEPYLKQARLNADFLDRAVSVAAALPGVQSAAAIDASPLTPGNWNGSVTIAGEEYEPGDEPTVEWRWVTPGYFESVGLPLLRGRTFQGSDRPDGARVAVVNRTFAERLLGTGDWLNRKVQALGNLEFTIVGVVGDAQQSTLYKEPLPAVYFRMGQAPAPIDSTLVLRTAVAPESMAETLVRTVATVNRDVPVYAVRSMRQILLQSIARQRFATVLMTLFAGAAVLIASVGLFGVMSYTVSLRSHDIGVRMAVGARRGRVLSGVLAEGLKLAGLGSLIGNGLALAMSGMLASLVFQLSPREPWLYVVATGLLMVVAAFASLVPAWRASRINPVEALRYE